MLIPIGHDSMSARRWPVVTFGLILVNFVVFLGTHWVMEKQDSQLWEVRDHILILAARNPSLLLSANAREYVDWVESHFPDDWAELQNPNAEIVDSWDAQIRQINDPVALQAEMDSLEDKYSQLMDISITQRYGFVPAHATLMACLTSTFLHGGWWHLIGNMWFLWLAGFVLEDTWGRPLYLLIYLTAGVLACHVDAASDPRSIVPSIGASGAVAGLMGAFLVRFPKMKIRMIWFFDLGILPLYRFWMPSYCLLPVWALRELAYGTGPRDGIGHWAHVGGFLLGAGAALVVRHSDYQRETDKAIEQKITWTAESEIIQASSLMDKGKVDEAASVLNQYLAANPESIEARNLLRAVYWRASKVPDYREATGKLCELHLKAHEWEAAWQDYQNLLTVGGNGLPPSAWFDFCRMLEARHDSERAMREYENLAAIHPSERQRLLALLGAARICLNRLNRPQDALRFYEAAAASALRHLDLERDIQSGIREAKIAIAQGEGPPAGVTSG